MKKNYLLGSTILFIFICLVLFSSPSLALIPGDFNSDGQVQFEDLMIFALAYGSTSSDANWNPVCDIASAGGVLEPDGVVDFEDLMVFALHYGEEEDDLAAALVQVQANTTITGDTEYTDADDYEAFTATFPTTVPAVFDTAGYQIDSRITLSAELPAGSNVLLTRADDGGAPVPYYDGPLPAGTSFWITDLLGGVTPANFNAATYNGKTEAYTITITGNTAAITDTTVLVESIISSDDFGSDLVVLADFTFTVNLSAYDELDRYVSTTGNNGNDGSMASPWLTVQYAIDNTPDGGTVFVFAGTYNENLVFDGSKELIVQSESGDPSDTIIDGGGIGSVVLFSGGDTSTLEGFTIQHGSAALHGGGIRVVGSSSYIFGNTITGNTAPNGGGIYINAGSPIITGNTISNNTTSGYGGGIDMNSYSSPIITGNTISNNTADGGGAGISMLLSSPTIDGNNIESNVAGGWSGGIDVDNLSFPIIQNNSITGNTAVGPGGGIAVSQNCDLLPYDDRPVGWGNELGVDGYRENIPSYVSPVAGNTFSGNSHLGGSVANGADVFFSTTRALEATRSARTFEDYLR
jgi:hypothetical protein